MMGDHDMEAFIIAGGEGTRLRPYTYSAPKPMLMLGGKPILWYVLQNLKRNGIKKATLTVGYKHEQIESYFGDGSSLGMELSYSVEKEKRNTAGSIAHLKGRVKEPFMVLMGDHLTNIDLKGMIAQHKKQSAAATIALYRSTLPLEYGVAQVEGGRIIGFQEKPLLCHDYNTAIYLFSPEVFEHIGLGDDFAKDVIPRLIGSGKKVIPYVFDEVWYDIGRVGDYERLRELFDVSRLLSDLRA